MGSGASRNNKPSKESSRRGVQWPQDGSNQDEFKRKRSEVKVCEKASKIGISNSLSFRRIKTFFTLDYMFTELC